MRTQLVLAILVMSILAGCSDKGGGKHSDTFTCPDGKKIDISVYPDHENATFNATSKCPKSNTTKTNATSNTTSRAPNVLPNLVFRVTNSTGNVSNVTWLDGNLTFDATGTADPDGNITGLAMTVVDSNQSRTVSLFDPATKTFTPKTLVFDRAGRVNVTVAVVDERGGFATLLTRVYVNEAFLISQTFQGSVPTAPSSTAPGQFPMCAEGLNQGNQTLVAGTYFTKKQIAVADDAGWIEANITSGAAYTICSPSGQNLTAQVSSPGVAATNGTTLPAARTVDNYFVAIYKTGAPAPTTPVTGRAVVHYEPKPTA